MIQLPERDDSSTRCVGFAQDGTTVSRQHFPYQTVLACLLRHSLSRGISTTLALFQSTCRLCTRFDHMLHATASPTSLVSGMFTSSFIPTIHLSRGSTRRVNFAQDEAVGSLQLHLLPQGLLAFLLRVPTPGSNFTSSSSAPGPSTLQLHLLLQEPPASLLQLQS